MLSGVWVRFIVDSAHVGERCGGALGHEKASESAYASAVEVTLHTFNNWCPVRSVIVSGTRVSMFQMIAATSRSPSQYDARLHENKAVVVSWTGFLF